MVKRAQTLIEELNQFKVDESRCECMRVGGQTLARVATLTNSHPRLTGPLDRRVDSLTREDNTSQKL